jgi:hypothetical protein
MPTEAHTKGSRYESGTATGSHCRPRVLPLSQAVRKGTSANTVARWERGEQAVMSEPAQKLAQLFASGKSKRRAKVRH